ncbi:MAG: DUF417 family protein [Blastocatellia bacterium]|nr:DUF417 family protein [Blastocatellia bacterium]
MCRDLDYHFIRASMVIVFLFFGYQKWFEYEAQALIPYISNGPLISWMYPVFGTRGATWFLGVTEWTITAGSVRRGGLGAVDRLRKRRQSDAGALDNPVQRNCFGNTL